MILACHLCSIDFTIKYFTDLQWKLSVIRDSLLMVSASVKT